MTYQTIDKPTLINRALTLHFGNPALYSIDGNDNLAAACNMAYDETLYECFSLHDWTFARRTTQLVLRAEEPVNGFSYGFELPGDRIGHPLKVLNNPRSQHVIREYAIEGNVLYCNHPQVWVRCTVMVDPKDWRPEWTAAFVLALAAKLAISVQQDEELAANKDAEAFGSPSQGRTGGRFGRLMAQDRAASPTGSEIWKHDPLTDARW